MSREDKEDRKLHHDYVSPRNEVEQTIANIWQILLNVSPVGVHDNFFELGGDSFVLIQMIAEADKAGIQLDLSQLLEHQVEDGLTPNRSSDLFEKLTVSWLARLAERSTSAEQNLQELPLLPRSCDT